MMKETFRPETATPEQTEVWKEILVVQELREMGMLQAFAWRLDRVWRMSKNAQVDSDTAAFNEYCNMLALGAMIESEFLWLLKAQKAWHDRLPSYE